MQKSAYTGPQVLLAGSLKPTDSACETPFHSGIQPAETGDHKHVAEFAEGLLPTMGSPF
jgi:hypothetical protein